MNDKVLPNAEDVARVLFYPSFFEEANSPFFCDGVLSPVAFKLQVLRSGTVETSISVLRVIFPSFIHDITKLSPRNSIDIKCGYALLNVGEVKELSISSSKHIQIDVLAASSKRLLSHAEIVLHVDGNIVTALDETIEVIRFRKKLARLASKRMVFL